MKHESKDEYQETGIAGNIPWLHKSTPLSHPTTVSYIFFLSSRNFNKIPRLYIFRYLVNFVAYRHQCKKGLEIFSQTVPILEQNQLLIKSKSQKKSFAVASTEMEMRGQSTIIPIGKAALRPRPNPARA